MSKEDTSIDNVCMYTTDIWYSDDCCCDTIINDDEDFCSNHKGFDYETMFEKRKQVLYKLIHGYERLHPYYKNTTKKYVRNCVYKLVKKCLMCLSDNEFNNRLSDFFLEIGYPDTHSQLCIMASKLHERRISERKKKEKNKLVMTSDKIILHV